ncbi:unnamed protein product [Mesocestoides corti]|uniref:Uncharacterized protein n=1 Tax=Mesocestoides corti TaxID=53468 RepID=A0A0R3U133_MESCO|nr:unnamed protein product [Mesocestoides corti]
MNNSSQLKRTLLPRHLTHAGTSYHVSAPPRRLHRPADLVCQGTRHGTDNSQMSSRVWWSGNIIFGLLNPLDCMHGSRSHQSGDPCVMIWTIPGAPSESRLNVTQRRSQDG